MHDDQPDLTRWAARSILALALTLAWLFCLPTSGQAQADPAQEDDSCVTCHSDEGTAWTHSPHGQVPPESAGMAGGASCVDCHGPYIKGHPASGTITLTVDSSQCQTCHTDTYVQWQGSQHAQDNVQCISCHRPHSQELRLTDESLCQSCHHESLADPLHTAHWTGDATCTTCHLADVPQMNLAASQDPTLGRVVAPSHDFVTVSSKNCLDCHADDVSATPVATTAGNAAATHEAQLLAGQLEQTQRANKSLTTFSAANLGFGLGIGGILGIVFMLIGAGRMLGRK
jgi:hypothetical protein